MTPDDLGLYSADGGNGDEAREFTITGLGDVDEIVIDIALAEDVSIDGGDVSFEADDPDATDLIAAFDANATLDSYEIDDVSFPGTKGTAIDVEGVDELSFVVEQGGVESVVPVAYVGDAGDDLAIDADGLPTDGFGIGGETYFVDPALTPESTAVTGVIGETAEVSVQVEDGAGNDLELAGIELLVGVTSDVGESTYDDITAGNRLADFTVETGEDGVATFAVDNLADDAGIYVNVKWEGAGALADVEADTAQVTVDWVESDGVFDSIALETTSAVDASIADGANVASDDVDHVLGVGMNVPAGTDVGRADVGRSAREQRGRSPRCRPPDRLRCPSPPGYLACQ